MDPFPQVAVVAPLEGVVEVREEVCFSIDLTIDSQER